jgi:hypothetical protein
MFDILEKFNSRNLLFSIEWIRFQNLENIFYIEIILFIVFFFLLAFTVTDHNLKN